jgi:uncharacterized OB-fold protein
VSATAEPVEVSVCDACQSRFLPIDGPCPRCGSPNVRPYSTPSLGTVLAATELSSPAEGWPPNHRIALVELPEAVRLLAIVEGALPAAGTLVGVRKDGVVYRARNEPGP